MFLKRPFQKSHDIKMIIFDVDTNDLFPIIYYFNEWYANIVTYKKIICYIIRTFDENIWNWSKWGTQQRTLQSNSKPPLKSKAKYLILWVG